MGIIVDRKDHLRVCPSQGTRKPKQKLKLMLLTELWVVKSFVSDSGSQCLLLTSLNWRHDNILADKYGEISESLYSGKLIFHILIFTYIRVLQSMALLFKPIHLEYSYTTSLLNLNTFRPLEYNQNDCGKGNISWKLWSVTWMKYNHSFLNLTESLIIFFFKFNNV